MSRPPQSHPNPAGSGPPRVALTLVGPSKARAGFGAVAPSSGAGAASPEQDRQRGTALRTANEGVGGAAASGVPPRPGAPATVALTLAARRPRGSGSASGRRRRSARTAARPIRPRTRRTARPRGPGGEQRGDRRTGVHARPRPLPRPWELGTPGTLGLQPGETSSAVVGPDPFLGLVKGTPGLHPQKRWEGVGDWDSPTWGATPLIVVPGGRGLRIRDRISLPLGSLRKLPSPPSSGGASPSPSPRPPSPRPVWRVLAKASLSPDPDHPPPRRRPPLPQRVRAPCGGLQLLSPHQTATRPQHPLTCCPSGPTHSRGRRAEGSSTGKGAAEGGAGRCL